MIPCGAGAFEFAFRTGEREAGMTVWTYKPRCSSFETRPLDKLRRRSSAAQRGLRATLNENYINNSMEETELLFLWQHEGNG